MKGIRRALWRAPLALGTCFAFLGSTLLPAHPAVASDAVRSAERVHTAVAVAALATEDTEPADASKAVAAVGPGPQAWERGAAASAAPTISSDFVPLGGAKTGVSSQAISLPQGAGKIQGMGESFSTDLSTGVATFTVPFSLVPARGGAQPALALHYSSAAGHGVAGVGWEVGVPFIARQTDRGLPQYQDPATGGAWAPTQDRFVFNGGQELVPICLVSGGSCPGSLSAAGEVMPAWSDRWQYFRARVDGSYLRFFWSPDHRTWRVQSKTGESMELGAPLDSSGDTSGLETDPGNPSHVFRWDLVRQYDAYGNANPSGSGAPAPVNLVVYRYRSDGATAYLSDVFDTPPAASPSTAPLTAYAHHTHLSYEARPDATFSFRRGWQATQGLRLIGVDVTSANFGASGPRELVRRYHLSYDPAFHVSLLASLQLEGRCASTGGAQITESGGLLPPTSCPTLPPMTFGYQHVAPFDTGGNPSTADLPGWEGFDERVHAMASSPDHSLDETLTDLFDVNADGLPDVVVTAPFLYGGKHAVFFNGAGGTADAFGANKCMDVSGVPGEDTNVIRLDNPNIAAHDIDGNGIIDLLHMPMVKTYSIYGPQAVSTPPAGGCNWQWLGRQVATASQQSPKIDLTNHNDATRVMDVNGDGLVDVVFSAGTEYQTFFSLGRYPNGDGQYGTAQWTGATSSSILTDPHANDPATSCLPWSARVRAARLTYFGIET